MDYTGHYLSPLGAITLASDGTALTGLWFDGQKYFARTLTGACEERALPVFAQAAQWLDTYFDGRIPEGAPPLRLIGTEFQRRVWAFLLTIPYGQTASYGQIARAVAGPGAARAVGSAIGRNPVSLIVPCHRAIGSGGRLTGYAGGLDRKAWLLHLERGE